MGKARRVLFFRSRLIGTCAGRVHRLRTNAISHVPGQSSVQTEHIPDGGKPFLVLLKADPMTFHILPDDPFSAPKPIVQTGISWGNFPCRKGTWPQGPALPLILSAPQNRDSSQIEACPKRRRNPGNSGGCLGDKEQNGLQFQESPPIPNKGVTRQPNGRASSRRCPTQARVIGACNIWRWPVRTRLCGTAHPR